MCRAHPARAFCNEFFNPDRTEASPVPSPGVDRFRIPPETCE
jgi:hypothetical protein